MHYILWHKIDVASYKSRKLLSREGVSLMQCTQTIQTCKRIAAHKYCAYQRH